MDINKEFSPEEISVIREVINKLGGIEGARLFLRDELKVVENIPIIRRNTERLLQGGSKKDEKKHIIDCDADPFVPERREVVEHRKCGQFVWDPDKIELYLCDEQKSGKIERNKLWEKLKEYPVLNANVLDYLLEHPELIPDKWQYRFLFICFWGTIYRSPDGYKSIRCLFWRSHNNWRSIEISFISGDGMDKRYPAVIFCK